MELNTSENLLPEKTYHVYNKTVGKELMFITGDDYTYFLLKAQHFLLPVCNLYAYCLMPNHFHFLLRIKAIEEITNNPKDDPQMVVKRAFSNFFISYAKSFNYAHFRLGRLFLQSFKRILVDHEDYFLTLVNYIHRNPIHHGYVSNYDLWKFSSYHEYIDGNKTYLYKDEVFSYFNSIDDFIEYHEENKSGTDTEGYLLE
jgi:REP element-mobilizing transposase RayT